VRHQRFGALAEAREMIRRPINQKLIGKDYINAMELDGRNVYGGLNKHFGKSNLLHRLRNTLVYHCPEAADLEAAFEDVPEDEDWAWYPSDTINNSFYLASDMVITAGVLRATGETDTANAYEKVMGIVIPVSNDMTDFFLHLMRAIIVRHLGPQALNPIVGTGTKIENAPNLWTVSIPFIKIRDDAPQARIEFRPAPLFC
jgi:hypothetical protein